jgi:hypothetical protein
VESEILRRRLLVQARRWVGVRRGYAKNREYKEEDGKEIAVLRKAV